MKRNVFMQEMDAKKIREDVVLAFDLETKEEVPTFC
jgi:hypothetical protein